MPWDWYVCEELGSLEDNVSRMAHREPHDTGQKGSRQVSLFQEWRCATVVPAQSCAVGPCLRSWAKSLRRTFLTRLPGVRSEYSSSAETEVKQLVSCVDVLWPQRTAMPELYWNTWLLVLGSRHTFGQDSTAQVYRMAGLFQGGPGFHNWFQPETNPQNSEILCKSCKMAFESLETFSFDILMWDAAELKKKKKK